MSAQIWIMIGVKAVIMANGVNNKFAIIPTNNIIKVNPIGPACIAIGDITVEIKSEIPTLFPALAMVKQLITKNTVPIFRCFIL